MQTYTIQSGDTLGTIALRFLGSSSRYMEIFNANTDVLANPNLILPGQVIKIPGSVSTSSSGASNSEATPALNVSKFFTDPKFILIGVAVVFSLGLFLLPKPEPRSA